MLKLYAAIGCLTLIIGAYFYGHHEGALSGEVKVAKLETQLSTATTKFDEERAAQQQMWQGLVDAEKAKRTKDELTNQKRYQSLLNLNHELFKQSRGYVTAIERLSEASPSACNSALELADRQYDEIAKFATATAGRADEASSIANTLYDYAVKIQ